MFDVERNQQQELETSFVIHDRLFHVRCLPQNYGSGRLWKPARLRAPWKWIENELKMNMYCNLLSFPIFYNTPTHHTEYYYSASEDSKEDNRCAVIQYVKNFFAFLDWSVSVSVPSHWYRRLLGASSYSHSSPPAPGWIIQFLQNILSATSTRSWFSSNHLKYWFRILFPCP